MKINEDIPAVYIRTLFMIEGSCFAESANARSTSAPQPSVVRLLEISDRHSLKLNAENLKTYSHGLHLPQIC